jgi:hypothetical protein
MSYFILLLSFRPLTSFLFCFSFTCSFSSCFHPNPSFFQFLFLLHVFCSTNLFHHHAKNSQSPSLSCPLSLTFMPIYIEFYLLGYSTVQSVASQPTFRSNIYLQTQIISQERNQHLLATCFMLVSCFVYF